MINNDEDYLIRRTYTNYGGVNMAFDLSDEELQATREMNKTAWKSEIDKWSREYLIERYKDLVEIEKEHKKENGELRERVEELETAYLLQKDRSIELTTTIDALTTDYKEEKEKNKELLEGLKYRVNYCKLLEKELYGNGINYNMELTKIEKKYLQELLEERN